MRLQKFVAAVAVAVCPGLLAGAAGAAVTTVYFTGVVTANNPFVNIPAIGSAITGRFTIDPANNAGDGANCEGIPDCWSGTTSSWVWNGQTISLQSGFPVVPSLFRIGLSLSNSTPGGGPDRYEVNLGGYSFTTVKLTLTDTRGTAFELAANPLLPSFGAFTSATFTFVPLCLTGISCAGNQYYSGTLASFSTTPGGGAAPPSLGSVKSRKVHGTAGTFDVLLSPTPANPTTEPRLAGAGDAHAIVFTFNKAVTSGTASVTAGVGVAGAPVFSGSEMTIPLTGVADAQYVTVTVANVASADGGTGGTGSTRIGFLAGDVDGSRSVTLSDLLDVNAFLAQTVTAASFLRDVDVSGALTLADKLQVNARLTRALPLP